MSFLILNCIITFVDAALLLYFVTRFLNDIKSGYKAVIFALMLITAINTSAGLILGDGNPVTSLLMIGTTVIIYRFILNEKFLNILLFFFLGLLLMFVAEAVSILTLLAFGIVPNQIHESFYALLAAGLISKSVYYLLVKYLLPRLKQFKGISKIQAYQILLICIFNIIIIFMAFWFYKNTHMPLIKEHLKSYIAITTLGAMVFSIGILSLFRGIIKQSQKESEWLIREEEYKKQMFYIDNIEDMLKSVRAQRHDFNNHMNCIYGLLKLDKTEEASEYIKRLVHEAATFNSIIDTGNPVISSLLNTKISTALRNNIQVQTDIRLPEHLNIEPIDISIIIGNLMDNALEACAAVESADKFIQLDVYHKNQNLIIKVKNTKSELINADISKLEKGFTSKLDRKNHGLGLFNIKQAISKYDGVAKFEDKGSSFDSSIAIPVK